MYHYFKYFFDFVFALLLLVLLSPLLLVIAFAIYFHSGLPIFFTQYRPGFRSKAFRLIKFRSMANDKDSNGRLRPDSDRLSAFGCFLRSTSLDELPSLLNILMGDMSFIGPRPLLMEYLPLYSSFQARRHDVKPGFSGWAQINGRNSLSWDQKFRLDVWYVDRQNFWLDLRIFLITIWKVFRREGISASGEATMAPFIGSASASRAR